MTVSSEAAATWVAIVLTAVGGITTTAIHYGSTTAQIDAVQKRQDAVETKAARHDDQISELQKQTSAINQNLTDIHDTVHDIQDKVSKRK
jgi:peptidoglycan hydrolase CwlO-like protein